MNQSARDVIKQIADDLASATSSRSFEQLITLEQSLDHLPLGVTVFDDDLRLTAWNKTIIDIFPCETGPDGDTALFRDGRPIGEIIERLSAAGFYGRDAGAQLTDDLLRKLASEQQAREYTLEDGRILEVRGFCSPNGGYVYITQDVTVQRQAESATKELAAIVSSSEASILGLSPEGIITSWNAGAEHMYGYTAEEAIGQPSTFLSGNESQKEGQLAVWQRVMRGERVIQTVGERTHKDGHTFSISLSMSPIFGDDGSIVGASGVAHDITERLRAEQALAKQRDELERLNGQKNRLFSIIAHDLRTPFNSLLGFSEILSDHAATLAPNEISEYAAMMHDSARQANALLETLLEWARLQMGGLRNDPRPFDVTGTIEQAMSIHASTAANKEINLTRLDSPLLTALADPDMVETVLRNLIGNAVKFTERGGLIEIAAERQDDTITVSVRDNGIGIPPERLAKLFAFETGASTAGTDGEKGTGLGLQLCKELVELQGGTLNAESKPGQGSTFRLTLPSAI